MEATRHIATLLSGALLLCAPTSTAGSQDSLDALEKVTEICLTSAASRQEFSDALVSTGWSPVANHDLTDDHVHQWAAKRLAEDMAFGKKAVVRWRDAWARALKNGRGLRRRVVIEGDNSVQYFFESSSEGGLLEAKFTRYGTRELLECSLVARPEFAAQSLYPVALRLLDDRSHAVVRLRTQRVDSAEAKRSINVFLLRQDQIERFLEMDFPYFAAIWIAQDREK